MQSRRDILKGASAIPFALGGWALNSGLARAQQFPTRTITLISPFAPGGLVDLAARPLATFLTQRFPHPTVVDHKPGAGGGVGHAFVARAEPDGYTFMVTVSSWAAIPEANRIQGLKAQYDVTEFQPLARLLASSPVLAVRSDAPWKSVEELLEDARKNPDKISYGSNGQFGTVHLAMEMALQAAGATMLHVPFRGGGPAVQALMSKQIDVRPTVVSNVKGLLDAGEVRLLAQLGEERMESLPDVPTLVELGYKDVVYLLWTGVFAPAKIPQHAEQTLRSAIKDFMHREHTIELFRRSGADIGYMDGPEFAKFLEKDNARLWEVARRIKLT
jgi:tripartite-type tricarboxylate transporter receptor subunit TctC